MQIMRERCKQVCTGTNTRYSIGQWPGCKPGRGRRKSRPHCNAGYPPKCIWYFAPLENRQTPVPTSLEAMRYSPAFVAGVFKG